MGYYIDKDYIYLIELQGDVPNLTEIPDGVLFSNIHNASHLHLSCYSSVQLCFLLV